MNKKLLSSIFCLFLFLPMVCFSLNFSLPKPGCDIVGEIQTTEVQDGEDFSDIALRFGIGYYEIFETNPRIDPDNPPNHTEIIIPTQYILPKELKPNEILINLAEMRLYYSPENSGKIYIFPVGIGKVDWDTPTGEMHIIRKEAAPVWTVPEGIRKYRAAHNDILPKAIPAGPENPLGSYALRLSGGDFLIHGTNLPAGVGRRSSAGCIRLYEQDIKQLFSMVHVNTKVLIINNPYKAGWKNRKLYLEAHLPLFEQRLEAVAGDMTPIIDIIDQANQNSRVDINWKKAFQIANEHIGIPRIVGK